MIYGYVHKSAMCKSLTDFLLGVPEQQGETQLWDSPAPGGSLSGRLITWEYFQHVRICVKWVFEEVSSPAVALHWHMFLFYCKLDFL